jgi:hypothetical protein
MLPVERLLISLYQTSSRFYSRTFSGFRSAETLTVTLPWLQIYPASDQFSRTIQIRPPTAELMLLASTSRKTSFSIVSFCKGSCKQNAVDRQAPNTRSFFYSTGCTGCFILSRTEGDFLDFSVFFLLLALIGIKVA